MIERLPSSKSDNSKAPASMRQRDISTRLENWAHWAGLPIHSKHVTSMTGIVCERMRKSSLGNVWTGVEPRIEIDEHDAQQVEAAWARLNEMQKAILRWHYVRNARPEFICRKLRIPVRPSSFFTDELARAVRAIEALLSK